MNSRQTFDRFAVWFRRALPACLALTLASVTVAQSNGEELVNRRFDDGFVAWETAGTTVVLDSLDAANRNDSMSVRITDDSATDNGGFRSISQCIPAFPEAPYQFGARTHIPTGQGSTVQTAVTVRFYNTTNCVGGDVVAEAGSLEIEAPGNWRPLIGERVVAPREARGVRILVGVRRVGDGGSGEALFDDVFLKPVLGNCEPDAFTTCLNDGRFGVQVSWQKANGEAGTGRATRLTPDGASFWFFQASNQELLVKVVDGCGINQRYWVFAAATTDVQFDLSVVDTQTGESRNYRNPQGVAAPAITDTGAFAGCN